jgi:NADPH-dependent 2,4-dienoyl-CoA reductase/sulfur reductase-like enzyme
MAEYRYVLVGGGMTAHAAAQAIRSREPTAAIAMITDEAVAPYARPPLSKGLWTGQEEGSIWLPSVDGLTLRTGARVAALDRGSRRVVLADGESIGYERLLLATGATPRRLPFEAPGIVYFRTVEDFRRVQALPVGKHVAVIGGGFIGSEMAAGLTAAGYRVTLIFPEEGIGARIFPRDLSLHLNGYYAEHGVEVRAGEALQGLVAVGSAYRLTTGRGEVHADLVVAGLGVVPNDRLAADAGLAVEDGIVVDASLRTNDPAVFAAGDVARFWNPALGRRMRVEHEDNANRMGRDAGLSMTGERVEYHHLPFFYSDLFELGYEAVGVLDPRLEVIADWKQPFERGVLYYVGDRRVRGVLAWGAFGKMDAARALVAEAGPHDASTLVGKIPL